MITFMDVINEIREIENFDNYRNRWLNEYKKITGRNALLYYSDFLNYMGNKTSLDENDIIGIANCIKDFDKNKPIDIILHTPGGMPTATQGIVHFLRSNFSEMNVIVPHMAMSAGTMLACASNTIYMSSMSSLGPIDPQFSGTPAFNIKTLFEDAKEELKKDPKEISYWSLLLSKYTNPAIYKIVCDAIDMSSELVRNWLKKYMFEHTKNKVRISKSITDKLNDNHKSHSKHLSIDYCKEIGLKIENIENNSDFYDCVYRLYYSSIITCQSTPACKIIAAYNNAYIVNKVISNQNIDTKQK